jgi:serine/threonine protein kinase
MALSPGYSLNNRYRIETILGQGGMGSVYRATDLNLGVDVAVKENQYLSAEFSRQFQREASVLANLRHPNLPRVSDYFTIQGQGQYLIMDYIEGEDLRQRIERSGSLFEKEVVLIGVEICDALDYLHGRPSPIVHRDIKPGNIKITPESKVYLVDFGLVKVMHGKQETSTGARAMTPGYSSPEQYGTARTDPRSDIYSLGATLYAALTAEIPEDSLARLTGKTKLTPISKLNPRINRKIAAAIEKALELEPEKRFQTAAEFKKALLDAANLTVQESRQLTISPPPVKPKAGSKVSNADGNMQKGHAKNRDGQKKGHGCGIFLFLLLFIVAVGGASTLFLKLDWYNPVIPLFNHYFPEGISLIIPISTPTPVTVTLSLPAPTQSSTPTLSFTSTPQVTNTVVAITPTEAATTVSTGSQTITATVSTTPLPTAIPLGGDSGRIAFSSNRTGSIQIWSMDVSGGSLTQLTNLSDGACQPAWSPNGQQLAFISPCRAKHDVYAGSSIYIMNADGSDIHSLPIPPDPAGDFDPAWSPDGQRIAFTSLRTGEQHIYVYNLTTSALSQVTKGPDAKDGQPAWSPSGTQLVFVRTSIFSQIWVVGDDGQNQLQFSLSGPVNDLYPVWSPDGQSIYYCQTNPDSYLPWLMRLRYFDRGTSNENRVPPPGQPVVSPIVKARISPDGSWIAYESWPDGTNHDIYLMKINGSDVQRLTDDSGIDFDPAWQPTMH